MENKLSLLFGGFEGTELLGGLENLAEFTEIDTDISNEEKKERMKAFFGQKIPAGVRVVDVMSEDEYRKLMNGEEYKVFLRSFKHGK